jgi:hypothetical protein
MIFLEILGKNSSEEFLGGLQVKELYVPKEVNVSMCSSTVAKSGVEQLVFK